jgi:pyruvate dehydrogenase E2 component (dihydrolipoamide acetyltransferase)
MSIFRLPDLGEGLPDAEITQWYVKEGDTVKADQPLVSMETAKAVVDVPAPQSGKILKLYGQAGDIINTGEPLVEFSSEATTMPAMERQSETAASVVGKTEVGNIVIEEAAMGVTPTGVTTQQIKIIPAVRILAKNLNVDLQELIGTGPHGQITAEDVKKAANKQPVPTPVSQAAGKPIIEPLRSVRRAMATAMAQSHAEVVPVTLVDDADIFRWPKSTDITARVIRSIVIACQIEPALNAHFHSKDLERHIFKHINIGIAMDSKDGLFVPVLKHANDLTEQEMRKTIERFKEQVKNRTVPQDDLKGSTIQLSNFGTMAGRYANPIIVPPTVAILGTGRIHKEVVPFEDMIAIHRILPLSLSIDHRAVTGGEAARFLAAVIADLEKGE